MSRLPCIKGCKYFAGMEKDGSPLCTREPKPRGELRADMGCWWGEREKKEADNENKAQGRLF